MVDIDVTEQQAMDWLGQALDLVDVDLVVEGRKVLFLQEGQTVAWLRPPETLVLGPDLSLDYPDLLLCVLVRTGQAAIALYEQGAMIDSQIIRKYMVRKSQGKSQLTFAKTRGKSRLGSRIRLQNAKAFFAEIGEKLNGMPVGDVDQILFYCPKMLLPFLWEEPLPFASDDDRLVKVPHHIHPPNLAEVHRVHRLCQKGQLTLVGELTGALAAYFTATFPAQGGT